MLSIFKSQNHNLLLGPHGRKRCWKGPGKSTQSRSVEITKSRPLITPCLNAAFLDLPSYKQIGKLSYTGESKP